MTSHGLVEQKTDEDGTEIYLLSPQGYDAHRRRVSWIIETMKGMRI
jgi:hypothetical protein